MPETLDVKIAEEIAAAKTYQQAGDLTQAVDVFRRILDAEPNQPHALHGLAGLAFQRGRYEEAIAWLRRVVEVEPANPWLQNNLGAAYEAAGRPVEAEACYRLALRLKPDLAEAYHNLGNLLRVRGQAAEALIHYQLAVLARPDYADAHQDFGLALMDAGRWSEAVEHLRLALRLLGPAGEPPALREELARAEAEARRQQEQASEPPTSEEPAASPGQDAEPAPNAPESLDEIIAGCRESLGLDPDNFEAYFRLGNALARQGNMEEAATALAHAVRIRPNQAGAYVRLGAVLREVGYASHAVGYLQFALRLRPGLVEAYHRLGQSLTDLGRLEEAAEAYRAALRLKPDFLPALGQLGGLLEELEPGGEGQNLLARALELGAEDPSTQNLYGLWLVNEGRVEEARSHFLKALALQPDFAPAHFSLVRESGHRYTDEEVRHLHDLLARENQLPRHRISLHFALARIYDRARRFDEAFYHCEQGNLHKGQLLGLQGNAFRPDLQARLADRLIATFQPEFFRKVRGLGSPSELPVFIIGMPRSGTSLVEQILASHPAVHGAGEIRDLRLLIDKLPEALSCPAEYPECLEALDEDKANQLAESYLRGLRRRGGEALRVTDKVPMHFHHLGLIATLWPRARIIHCRRDPRDVCWSCYFQNFRELHFACDLKMLGDYYRQYERLMAHWQEVLPVPVFEVRYEELVADLERVSREMIAFCGLPWDPACLAFYQTRRPVLTASNLQVRQPVYTKSIGYWKNYESHLGTLLEALGPEPGVRGQESESKRLPPSL